MKKILLTAIIAIIPCLCAEHSAHAQKRINQFPDANTELQGKTNVLSYGFYFHDRITALDICLIIKATVDPKILEFGFKYSGPATAPQIKVYFSKPERDADSIEVPCSIYEFFEILNIIRKHEVFEIKNDAQPRLEPQPMILGNPVTIVCIRNRGLEQTFIERKSILSFPVTHLVETLWENVMEKMGKMPRSELEKIITLSGLKADTERP